MSLRFQLQDFIPYYPERNDPDLQSKLYSKTEFTHLQAIEQKKVKEDGKYEFLAHQRNIARFLSGYTPYNGLLVYHMMGTGKTNCIIASIEQVRKEDPVKFVGALLLFRNDAQIEKFFSTDLPSILDTSDLKKRSTQRKKWYECHTIGSFLSKWEKGGIQSSFYDDCMIFIDEVHNIRKSVGSKKGSYDTLYQFLQSTRRSKIVLLTGTPMVDSDREIYDIINLLTIPKQIMTEDDLRQNLKGRVSYVNSIHNSRVLTRFMENPTLRSNKSLGSQKIYLIPFSKSQLEYIQYIGVKENKEVNKEEEVESEEEEDEYGEIVQDHSYNLRKQIQANLAVIPNSYRTIKEFITTFQSVPMVDRLEFLRQYSPKYASCIGIILDHPQQKHFAFIWDIRGVGLSFFKQLLPLFGISSISITGSNTAVEIIENIRIFNTSKTINVLLGSQVLAEGYSLLNVEFVHILTPHWNYTRIDQTIARAIRFSSHDELLRKDPTGKSVVQVQIYLYCMYSTNPKIPSVDWRMYQISHEKDLRIKKMEHLLKISSWDCLINKKRNTLPPNLDGTRQCDYEKCDYNCLNTLDEVEYIDPSTDNAYFSEQTILTIKNWILEQIQRMRVVNTTSIMEYLISSFGDTSKRILYLEAIDRILSEYGNIHLLNDVLYILPEDTASRETLSGGTIGNFLEIFQVSGLDRYEYNIVEIDHQLLNEALTQMDSSLLDKLSQEYTELLFESLIILYRIQRKTLIDDHSELLHTFFRHKKIIEVGGFILSNIDPHQPRRYNIMGQVWENTNQIIEDDIPIGNWKGFLDHEGNFKLITGEVSSSDRRKRSRGLICSTMTITQRKEKIAELKQVLQDPRLIGPQGTDPTLLEEIRELNDKTPQLSYKVCNLLQRVYDLQGVLYTPKNKWMNF